MERERIKVDLLIHDLKVPLAVIDAGITSLMKRKDKYGDLTDRQEKVLMRSLRNTKILQALVNDALELSRSGQGIVMPSTFTVSHLVGATLVEIFDLTDWSTSEYIRNCANLSFLKTYLEDRGMFLSVQEDLWCREVCMDETKVRQILRNLLVNALKYKKSRVELIVEQRGDALFILVRDDGEGIPPSFHKKIFQSYFQMDSTSSYHVRGHGLGLAGVMVLIEDLGGKLTLESDEGKGATFSVLVPMS